MRTATYFKLALNMLLHSKLRSWLTIIGIVIGVGAVVGIVSLGQGLQESVNSRLSTLDLSHITISPGYSRATGSGFGGIKQFNSENQSRIWRNWSNLV